jgi:hypothetical protein
MRPEQHVIFEGATPDTATGERTVREAGAAVTGLMAEQKPEGKGAVHGGGVEEVVADKGYHSYEVMRTFAEMEWRTYVAEPNRGKRQWAGKQPEKRAVYGNRRRIGGERGKRLQRARGEKLERNCAHQFDTGGMDRLWVRGLDNAHKNCCCQPQPATWHYCSARSMEQVSRKPLMTRPSTLCRRFWPC